MSSLWAFLLAGGVTLFATPIAIAIACRTNFYDHPVGYKGHERATPYLGGVAVFTGFAVASLVVSGAFGEFGPLLLCAAALLALGTLDDRVSVSPGWRVAVELCVAVVLYAAGLGWERWESDVANLALTVAWILGLINAFNLIDNLDGAATSLAGVCSTTVGVLALIGGAAPLAALAFAAAGASLAFLRYNLARPARIFLGDGGSMTLGFLVAAMTIAAVGEYSPDRLGVLGGAMLVALPILDTSLVVFSRHRAELSVLCPGRDHMTHRLLTRLQTPRRVAVAIGLAQSVLGGLAIAGVLLGPPALMVLTAGCVAGGLLVIMWLDSSDWSPYRLPPGASPPEQIAFGPLPDPLRNRA